MTDEPRHMTVHEACRRGGVGRTKLYEEMAAGRIVARKAGRRTLIDAASLDLWIESLPAWRPEHGAAA